MDGFSHAHAAYFTDEIDRRPSQVSLVAARPHRGDAYVPPSVGDSVPVIEDLAEMLDVSAPDVLIVSGEYAGRATATAAALERGIDVLADKPVAVDRAGLDAVERVAAASRARLSIAFEKRWYPATLQARELVAAGAIGRIRQIQATGPHLLNEHSRPAWYFDGGYGDMVADLPLHDVDLALLLTGAERGTVSASRIVRGDGFGTACLVTMDLDGQAVAALDANWLWPGGTHGTGRYQMRITGEEGIVYLDFDRPTIELVGGVDVPDWAAPARGAIELPRGLRPAQEFFDARLEGREPEVTTHASLAASEVVVRAGHSASHGSAPVAWDVADIAAREEG